MYLYSFWLIYPPILSFLWCKKLYRRYYLHAGSETVNRLVIVNGPTTCKYIKICLLWSAKQLTAAQFQTVTSLKVWSLFFCGYSRIMTIQIQPFPVWHKGSNSKKKKKKRKKGFESGFWGSKIYILYIFLENEGLVETEFNCYSIQFYFTFRIKFISVISISYIWYKMISCIWKVKSENWACIITGVLCSILAVPRILFFWTEILDVLTGISWTLTKHCWAR